MTQVDLKEGMVVNLIKVNETPQAASVSGTDIVPISSPTGELKNVTIDQLIDEVDRHYVYPADVPISGIDIVYPVTAGTYTNFNGIVVTSYPSGDPNYPGDLQQGLVMFRNVSGTWTKFISQATIIISDTPPKDLMVGRPSDVPNSLVLYGSGTIGTWAGALRTAALAIKEGQRYKVEGFLGVKAFLALDASQNPIAGAKWKINTGDAVNDSPMPFEFVAPAGAAYFVANLKQDSGDTATVNNIANVKITEVFLPGKYNQVTYAQLKTLITNKGLKVGQEYMVSSGTTIFTTVAGALDKVNPNVNLLGQDFDYYILDLTNNKIHAYDSLACVIRNESGTWAYINDGNHSPKGFTTISQPTLNQVQINYAKTYTRVKSLVACPDETYAKIGVNCGASVGLANSLIEFSIVGGVYGRIAESAGSLTVADSGFNTALASVSFNTGNGNITVTHSISTGGTVVINSLNAAHRHVLISKTDTTTVIRMYDNAGNPVLSASGMNFEISRTGARYMSNGSIALASSNIWVSGIMAKEFALT